mmetsp:Transcript_26911/g.107704  ORF Transcript_26911/g.107704 Transcript_26911/m.107704 type:complete len:232 (-) Transcript_26911:347-1042(-)
MVSCAESVEFEFIARDSLVQIVPKFTQGVMKFVAGNFGPFLPQHIIEVPLWLASQLQNQNMCAVITADWLNADVLALQHSAESLTPDMFCPLPVCYNEFGRFLCNSVEDELVWHGDELLSQHFEDIIFVRCEKLRRGMLGVASQANNDETTYSVKMNHVGHSEVSLIRLVRHRHNMWYAVYCRLQVCQSLARFFLLNSRIFLCLHGSQTKRPSTSLEGNTQLSNRRLRRLL